MKHKEAVVDGRDTIADHCKAAAADSDVLSDTSSVTAGASKTSTGLDHFVAFAFPSFLASMSRRQNASSGISGNRGNKRSADVCLDGDNFEVETSKAGSLLGGWWGVKRQKFNFAYEDDEATLDEEEKSSQEVVLNVKDSDMRLMNLPEDLLDQCFAFLCPAEDRAAASLTCLKFRGMINTERMLRLTDLFGCPSTGKRCIILEDDTTESALERLAPFLAAGSTDAMYLLCVDDYRAGMIKCYCHEDVEAGVALLRQATEFDHLESMYSLGIILRDSDREEATCILMRAHELGSLPATLEVLPASQVRKIHGDLTAEELRLHLGPSNLGKLMRRYFVDSSKARTGSSSHCWNPACGRWAYKNVHHSDRRPRPVEPVRMKCARMKVCSSCRRAKYCSKLCQVHDWRSGHHKAECQYIG